MGMNMHVHMSVAHEYVFVCTYTCVHVRIRSQLQMSFLGSRLCCFCETDSLKGLGWLMQLHWWARKPGSASSVMGFQNHVWILLDGLQRENAATTLLAKQSLP